MRARVYVKWVLCMPFWVISGFRVYCFIYRHIMRRTSAPVPYTVFKIQVPCVWQSPRSSWCVCVCASPNKLNWNYVVVAVFVKTDSLARGRWTVNNTKRDSQPMAMPASTFPCFVFLFTRARSLVCIAPLRSFIYRHIVLGLHVAFDMICDENNN